MNFKPTTWKVIASIIVGLLFSFLPFLTTPPSSSLIRNSIFGLIFLVFTYVLCSLFEKKK
jgi:Na+/proline symporter